MSDTEPDIEQPTIESLTAEIAHANARTVVLEAEVSGLREVVEAHKRALFADTAAARAARNKLRGEEAVSKRIEALQAENDQLAALVLELRGGAVVRGDALDSP